MAMALLTLLLKWSEVKFRSENFSIEQWVAMWGGGIIGTCVDDLFVVGIEIIELMKQ